MSSLNVQFNLKENNSGTPGAIISDPTFNIGDSFFVEVLMGDIRPNAFGLTSTSLNLNFDGDLIQNIDIPFNPGDPSSPLITPNFTFGRTGNLNNSDGTIRDLAGAGFPPIFGSPLGINELETYSLMKFEAINPGEALINLKIDISQTGFGDGTFADETDITEFNQTITIESEDVPPTVPVPESSSLIGLVVIVILMILMRIKN